MLIEKGENREMRGANNNALETISAAATAIASAENRVPQASVQVSNLIRKSIVFSLITVYIDCRVS